MQNPSLQREMMRGQDLAMSNIESLPEGFNALRRSYSLVQKPLLDAVDESTRQKFSINGNNDSLKGSYCEKKINSEPLPNPWEHTSRANVSKAAKPQRVPISDSCHAQKRIQIYDNSSAHMFISLQFHYICICVSFCMFGMVVVGIQSV